MPVDVQVNTAALKNIATQLRIDSVKSTSEAGSGHPTTCCSAAEIVSTLFFGEMRFDPQNPQSDQNDRFVLSKGHAAPILYAAWAEAGLFPRSEVMKLREYTSDLEGHPTPRLNFVDLATGSLGQGLAAAVGIALNARRIGSPARTYVVMGDGESAEGSVWEAAQMGEFFKLDTICAVTDVNRARTEPGDAARARPRAARGPLARLRLARDHGRRTRRRQAARRLQGSAGDQGQADDDPGPDAQGQGRVVRRGQGRLARQGLQEGRGAGQGARRARIAVDQGRRPARADPDAREEGIGARSEAEGARRDAGPGLQDGRAGRHPRGLRHRAGQAGRARSARRRARLGRRQLDVQRPLREAVSRSLLPGVHRRAGHDGRGHGPRQPRRHRLPVDVRVLPQPRLRLRPHGQHQHAERQDGRLARRRLDRRGRPVADGAGRPGDDARGRRLRRAVSVGRGQHRAPAGADGLPPRSGLHAHVAAEDAGHLRRLDAVPDRRLARDPLERRPTR